MFFFAVIICYEVSMTFSFKLTICRLIFQIVIHAGLLKKGLCSVQDESAGLVVSVVDPQPGETIVDGCAAPGGKTLYMASLLSGQGTNSSKILY